MDRRLCLMVVHAHPDDEVFSTGGIIARYAAAGRRVVVVYATNGEVGEMLDPERDPADAKTRLGEIRREEAQQAGDVLGVSDIFFLGFHDSGMADSPENGNPAAFMNQPFDVAVDRLMDVMQAVRADVVVTYNEDGGYGHPDHVMTHRITAAAFARAQTEGWGPRKLYYTASSRVAFRQYAEGLQRFGLKLPWIKDDFDFDTVGLTDDAISAWIDIGSYVTLKKRALSVHRTQIVSDHFYLQIPDEALTEVAGQEFFVRAVPPHVPGEREDDLFAGLSEGREAVA